MPTTIFADLRINTAPGYRDIDLFKSRLGKTFTQPLGRISGDAAEFSKSLQAAAARVTAFGAITGGIIAVNKAISGAARATIEVNKQLTELNTFLGETQGNLDQFGKRLFTVAKNTASGFEEVAEAAKEFARQGLSTEEVLKRTNDALVLSRISGLSFSQSVNGITTALNGFNKEALSSTEIINKLVAVDSRFAVSAGQLGEALTRVGSSAEESGLSFDQLIATVTTAQQITGRGGAVIGNALKTIFTRIRRPEIIDQLKELGVVVTDQNGQLLNAIEILKNYTVATKGLSQAEKTRTAELLGGVYQINQLQAVVRDLSSANSIYTNSLKVSIAATDEAQKKNEQLNKSYSALISQTAISAKQLGSEVGKNLFGPLITAGAGLSKKLLEALNPEELEAGSSKTGGNIATSIVKEFGKVFTQGLGNFLVSAGLPLITAIGGGLLLKLGKFVVTSSKTTLKEFSEPLGRAIGGGSLFGPNETQKQMFSLQSQISSVIQKNGYLTRATAASAYDEARARKAVVKEIQAENALLERQVSLARSVTQALYQKGYRDVLDIPVTRTSRRRRSQGYIPNFADPILAQEEQDARSKSAKNPKAYYTQATIKGKKQLVAVNDQEEIIPNFAGTGDTAIIPRYRKMQDIPRMGSGYVPNFSWSKTNKMPKEFLAKYPKSKAAIKAGRMYSPEVRSMLQKLKSGESIDRDLLETLIERDIPIREVVAPSSIKNLPSKSLIRNALDKEQAKRVGKLSELPAGSSISVRQDVPSMTRKGVGVVKTLGPEGFKSYDSFVAFDNPVMNKSTALEKASLAIGAGANKSPLLKISGTLSENQSLPKDLSSWTQVGFNPDRHSYYYDRKTKKPVVGGSKAIQIGNTVFVKDAQYGKKEDFLYAGGYVPNFAFSSTKSFVSGDRRFVDPETYSYLRYKLSNDKKAIDLTFSKSEAKGQGWQMFERLGKTAKRMGLPVRSASLSSQANDVYDITDASLARSGKYGIEQVLKVAFPQLIHRQKGSAKNTALSVNIDDGLTYDNSKVSGKNIFSIVAGLASQKFKGDAKLLRNSIIDGSFGISDIVTNFAGGRIPNFAKRKDIIQRIGKKEIFARFQKHYEQGKDYAGFYNIHGEEFSGKKLSPQEAKIYANITSAISPSVPDYVAAQFAAPIFNRYMKTKSTNVEDYFDLAPSKIVSRHKNVASLGLFGKKGEVSAEGNIRTRDDARRYGLSKALRGVDLGSDDTAKTRHYARAILQDKTAFPIDTNVIQAILGGKKPSKGEATKLISLANEFARVNNIETGAAGLQAAIFKSNSVHKEKYSPETVRSALSGIEGKASGYIPNFANNLDYNPNFLVGSGSDAIFLSAYDQLSGEFGGGPAYPEVVPGRSFATTSTGSLNTLNQNAMSIIRGGGKAFFSPVVNSNALESLGGNKFFLMALAKRYPRFSNFRLAREILKSPAGTFKISEIRGATNQIISNIQKNYGRNKGILRAREVAESISDKRFLNPQYKNLSTSLITEIVSNQGSIVAPNSGHSLYNLAALGGTSKMSNPVQYQKIFEGLIDKDRLSGLRNSYIPIGRRFNLGDDFSKTLGLASGFIPNFANESKNKPIGYYGSDKTTLQPSILETLKYGFAGMIAKGGSVFAKDKTVNQSLFGFNTENKAKRLSSDGKLWAFDHAASKIESGKLVFYKVNSDGSLGKKGMPNVGDSVVSHLKVSDFVSGVKDFLPLGNVKKLSKIKESSSVPQSILPAYGIDKIIKKVKANNGNAKDLKKEIESYAKNNNLKENQFLIKAGFGELDFRGRGVFGLKNLTLKDYKKVLDGYGKSKQFFLQQKAYQSPEYPESRVHVSVDGRGNVKLIQDATINKVTGGNLTNAGFYRAAIEKEAVKAIKSFIKANPDRARNQFFGVDIGAVSRSEGARLGLGTDRFLGSGGIFQPIIFELNPSEKEGGSGFVSAKNAFKYQYRDFFKKRNLNENAVNANVLQAFTKGIFGKQKESFGSKVARFGNTLISPFLAKGKPAFANGFIPNFNPIMDSVSREMKAGYSADEIRIGRSKRLETSFNEFGYGVYNEEEGSLNKAISLAEQSGVDPRFKGMETFSSGFTPNFAPRRGASRGRPSGGRRSSSANLPQAQNQPDFTSLVMQILGGVGFLGGFVQTGSTLLTEKGIISEDVNKIVQVATPLVIAALTGFKAVKSAPTVGGQILAGTLATGAGAAYIGLGYETARMTSAGMAQARLQKRADAASKEFKQLTEGTQELLDTITKLDNAFKDASTAPQELLKLTVRERELTRTLTKGNPALAAQLTAEPDVEKRIKLIEETRRETSRQQNIQEEILGLQSQDKFKAKDLTGAFSRVIDTAGERLIKINKEEIKPENLTSIIKTLGLERFQKQILNVKDPAEREKLIATFLDILKKEKELAERQNVFNKNVTKIQEKEIKIKRENEEARTLRAAKSEALTGGLNDIKNFVSNFGPRAAISFEADASKSLEQNKIISSFRNQVNARLSDQSLKLPENIKNELLQIKTPSASVTDRLNELSKTAGLSDEAKDSLEKLAKENSLQVQELKKISNISEINKEVQLKLLRIQEQLSFGGGINASIDTKTRIDTINAPLRGALQYRLGGLLGSERSQTAGLTNFLGALKTQFPGLLDKGGAESQISKRLFDLKFRDLQTDLLRNANLLQSMGFQGDANTLRKKALSKEGQEDLRRIAGTQVETQMQPGKTPAEAAEYLGQIISDTIESLDKRREEEQRASEAEKETRPIVEAEAEKFNQFRDSLQTSIITAVENSFGKKDFKIDFSNITADGANITVNPAANNQPAANQTTQGKQPPIPLGFSKGFIPSFANPLREAINRENKYVPLSLIRVNQSSKLISEENPFGLAVTNKIDEPNGLSDVALASKGYIPNYFMKGLTNISGLKDFEDSILAGIKKDTGQSSSFNSDENFDSYNFAIEKSDRNFQKQSPKKFNDFEGFFNSMRRKSNSDVFLDKGPHYLPQTPINPNDFIDKRPYYLPRTPLNPNDFIDKRSPLFQGKKLPKQNFLTLLSSGFIPNFAEYKGLNSPYLKSYREALKALKEGKYGIETQFPEYLGAYRSGTTGSGITLNRFLYPGMFTPENIIANIVKKGPESTANVLAHEGVHKTIRESGPESMGSGIVKKLQAASVALSSKQERNLRKVFPHLSHVNEYGSQTYPKASLLEEALAQQGAITQPKLMGRLLGLQPKQIKTIDKLTNRLIGTAQSGIYQKMFTDLPKDFLNRLKTDYFKSTFQTSKTLISALTNLGLNKAANKFSNVFGSVSNTLKGYGSSAMGGLGNLGATLKGYGSSAMGGLGNLGATLKGYGSSAMGGLGNLGATLKRYGQFGINKFKTLTGIGQPPSPLAIPPGQRGRGFPGSSLSGKQMLSIAGTSLFAPTSAVESFQNAIGNFKNDEKLQGTLNLISTGGYVGAVGDAVTNFFGMKPSILGKGFNVGLSASSFARAVDEYKQKNYKTAITEAVIGSLYGASAFSKIGGKVFAPAAILGLGSEIANSKDYAIAEDFSDIFFGKKQEGEENRSGLDYAGGLANLGFDAMLIAGGGAPGAVYGGLKYGYRIGNVIENKRGLGNYLAEVAAGSTATALSMEASQPIAGFGGLTYNRARGSGLLLRRKSELVKEVNQLRRASGLPTLDLNKQLQKTAEISSQFKTKAEEAKQLEEARKSAALRKEKSDAIKQRIAEEEQRFYSGLNEINQENAKKTEAITNKYKNQRYLDSEVKEAFDQGITVEELRRRKSEMINKAYGFIPNYAYSREKLDILTNPAYSGYRNAIPEKSKYYKNVIKNTAEIEVPAVEVYNRMGLFGAKPKNSNEQYAILNPAQQAQLGYASKGFIPNFAPEQFAGAIGEAMQKIFSPIIDKMGSQVTNSNVININDQRTYQSNADKMNKLYEFLQSEFPTQFAKKMGPNMV